LLRAARFCQGSAISLVLVESPNSTSNELLWEACRTSLDHAVLLARLPKNAGAEELALPLFAGRVNGTTELTAYVCRGETCSLPVHTKEDLHRLLSSAREDHG
jgi:uncharacterized protein YyaL (SSP411 family)